MTLYSLLNVIDLSAELAIYDYNGNLLVYGFHSDMCVPDDLLDEKVHIIIPGLMTKTFLDTYCKELELSYR